MGIADDSLAVVDKDLKVHGVHNLRVIDASVMPTVVGANTNAPTIMIAEKIADQMKEQYSLDKKDTINEQGANESAEHEMTG